MQFDAIALGKADSRAARQPPHALPPGMLCQYLPSVLPQLKQPDGGAGAKWFWLAPLDRLGGEGGAT